MHYLLWSFPDTDEDYHSTEIKGYLYSVAQDS